MKLKYFALLLILTTAISAGAQITINMPKLPGINKPKPEPTVKGSGASNGRDNGTSNDTGRGKPVTGGPIYSNQRSTATPVLIKTSVYVQAKAHNEYWKMPNQRNYSSWVPQTRFSMFYNNERAIKYQVEYFNPDGSAWYSEILEQGNLAADRTVQFQSPSPYDGAFDTKSTPAIGVFSFKITNLDSKELVFQGKFKVGKFSTSNAPADKNKFDFYVEHDWLMPFAVIGFHHSDIEIGGITPEVSVWLKGPVETNELEGRVFYKGQQIASTTDAGGSSGVSDYDERMTQSAPPFAPDKRWKRYQFMWNNFRVDNNGGFNRDYYPKAHYADKNPGDYVVKIYRNGAQIREVAFAVGADGRFVAPGYMSQVFLPYHRLLLSAKVMGTTEKWDSAAWKTDAFYGNPINGFTAP
ncbi:MAG TPA: hypothetical protein PKD26_09935 [Pyrinomonadaceae bacterium]|nr:hypothetical protein [Pyrinomonadaceae bacterium]